MLFTACVAGYHLSTFSLNMKKILAFAALSVLTVAAHAATPVASRLSISADAGTLGAGLTAQLDLARNFDARAGLHGMNYSYNTTSQGIAYNGHLKLESADFFADWHPFSGAFHLTGGIIVNNNRFNLTGSATSGTYTFNGATYTAAQAGSVDAKVTFNRVAPYLGIGWNTGHAGQAGLHFTSDIGVMYQGSPQARITATGSAANPVLASDVAASQAQLQSDLNSFRFYPVVQIGLAYRF